MTNTNESLTSSDLVNLVLSGKVDDNLDGISAAIKERKASVAKALLFTLKKDDRVRLGAGRPAYLNGAPATVVKIAKTRAHVTIDPDYLARVGGHRYSGVITVPAELLVPAPDLAPAEPKPKATLTEVPVRSVVNGAIVEEVPFS